MKRLYQRKGNMLLGTTLGLACFRQLSDRQFALAVNLLMAVSGIALLV